MEKINIDNFEFEGHAIPTTTATILLIKSARGFLGCGYFNIEAANRLNEIVAIVTGVKNFDDMLRVEVKQVSTAAAAAGITVGMTGRNALQLMR